MERKVLGLMKEEKKVENLRWVRKTLSSGSLRYFSACIIRINICRKIQSIPDDKKALKEVI